MANEKKWYAIYTRPRWEKKVADLLTKRKVENFCPLNKVVRQWADRKKTVLEPLFNSYVFVHTTLNEHLIVKQTEGVMNLVFWLGQPAIIRDEEIEAIKSFLQKHHDIKLEKLKININDKVRIMDGPLMCQEGDVVEVMNKSVKLYLPSLGYTMTAEIEKTRVEVINMAQAFKNESIYKDNLG